MNKTLEQLNLIVKKYLEVYPLHSSLSTMNKNGSIILKMAYMLVKLQNNETSLLLMMLYM